MSEFRSLDRTLLLRVCGGENESPPPETVQARQRREREREQQWKRPGWSSIGDPGIGDGSNAAASMAGLMASHGDGGTGSGGGSSGGSAGDGHAAVGGLNATVDGFRNRGARNQMSQGTLAVNGHTYNYRSGGHGRGNLPNGEYEVTPHLWSRNTPGMVVDGVGYSFALNNMFDPRVGDTRTELRIHPDGGSPGTNGCIGIVGDGATQKRFREDMRAELNQHGGRVKLRVG